jgi:hypothetical protein
MEEILSMTNEAGRRFCAWLKDCEILGTERTPDNISRKEFTVIFKDKERAIRTAVLSDKESNDDGSCFFGDLYHFACNYAAQMAGVKLRISTYGKIAWPIWYLNENDFLRWKGFYDEMMQKYS